MSDTPEPDSSGDAIEDDAAIPKDPKKVEEAFSLYDQVLKSRERDVTDGTPWLAETVERIVGSTTRTEVIRHYVPDLDLLKELVAIPIGRGDKARTGRLAKAFDAWVAHELRRAGFNADGVWPRTRAPRILPADLAPLEKRIAALEQYRETQERKSGSPLEPKKLRDAISGARRALPGRADATILGDFYDKQVDVVMSSWDRGPEILISTKTMVSSFGNNLTNRHEEAVGEISSLRRRHPMAATGFAFLAHHTVHDKGHYERLADIVRRLRRPGAYDATMLLVGDWDVDTPGGEIRGLPKSPDDLGPGRFFEDIIGAIISRTPFPHHEIVRERREQEPASGLIDEDDPLDELEDR